MSALINIIFPVFLVMGLGYVAARRRFLSHDGIDALMTFAQNFAVPLLLFRAISTLDLSAGYDPRLLGSYYTGSFLSFLAGMIGARLLFARPWDSSVAIGFSALFANSVLLGLAIMERAYGADSLAPNYAIISIHAPFCYFLGITSMEIVRHGKGGSGLARTSAAIVRAMFSNNLMVAIALGFATNLFGLVLPEMITGGLDLIVRAALPTALFALGGTLLRYRPEGDMNIVIMICLISLFVHPAIVLFMSTQVFSLPPGFVKGAVLTAAMAPGVNSFVFASMYGVAQRVAATTVLTGTLFSILSVSFWLMILGH